jgi:hypothetical protein
MCKACFTITLNEHHNNKLESRSKPRGLLRVSSHRRRDPLAGGGDAHLPRFALAAETSSRLVAGGPRRHHVGSVAPGHLYLRALLKSFWQMDELQRRIQIEAFGFALVGALVVLTAVNICKAEGIALLNYPQGLRIGGVYMTMFILWSVGVSVSTFRYR